jgi:nicotinamidase/pyrazinamidase
MNALILVDIQNDFVPGGALAVPDGDAVVAVANALMPHYDFVVATQDWHPAEHSSFADQHPGCEVGDLIEIHGTQQVLWPRHCVQNTRGAEFVPTLDVAQIDAIVHKGTNPEIDSYSGFFDNERRQATELHALLQEREVEAVTVIGLATDYCVKFTVMDACELGYRTAVVVDGVRGVELNPGDCELAFAEMAIAGANFLPFNG